MTNVYVMLVRMHTMQIAHVYVKYMSWQSTRNLKESPLISLDLNVNSYVIADYLSFKVNVLE